MVDHITRLREERAGLRARLEKIDLAIEAYERWADEVSTLVGPLPQRANLQDGASSVQRKMPDVGSAKRPSTSSVQEFEAAALMILEDAEKPYVRADLLDALGRLDVFPGGKEPANTMSTRLNRMAEVINLRGHGYWMKIRPYPPAGHFPDEDMQNESSSNNVEPTSGLL